MAATGWITFLSQLGVAYSTSLLEAPATHVAPSLDWEPNTEGPVKGEKL